MRQRVDCLPLSERALNLLTTVDAVLTYVQKFELPIAIQKNLVNIQDARHSVELPLEKGMLQKMHRLLFEALLYQLSEIENNFREILMTNGDIMLKLGRLPAEERDEICMALDIEYVPVEDRLSDDLKLVVHTVIDRIMALHDDVHQYYSSRKDAFVEYEDEREL